MCAAYYDIEASLGFLTITANRLMSAYFRKHLHTAGLNHTAEQWGVLAQIWNKGSMAQDELAYMLCVDKSSLSRVLDTMERRGLISRQRDPEDARRKLLYSTAAADALKEPCRNAAEAAMAAIMRDISPADSEVCLKVLAQIKENIRNLAE